MAGVSVKMGVDASQFTAGLKQAQNSVKTLDAQLKMNEKQLKATGDAELYMANQSQLLKKQMDEQKKVVSAIQKELEEMKRRGVDEASDAYQKLERSMYNAAGKLMDIQAQMNGLTTSEQKAAGGADELSQNLASINKKVSFDAVISGINSITGALENVVGKAKSAGQAVFNEIKQAAQWADDTATLAQMYEVPLERMLRMQALEAQGLDTSTQAILDAQTKLKVGIGKDNAVAMAFLKDIGMVTEAVDVYGNAWTSWNETDPEKMFWQAGQALMAMDPTRIDKEATAMALFGKSWRELIPLFTEYKSLEEYNEALNNVNVANENSVTNLAELSDKMGQLEHEWTVLKTNVLGALAPALSTAADALSNLIGKITEYLNTPEGQQLLKDMGDAVSGLFEDLSKIDPEKVVHGFKDVFDAIVGGLKWMVENKSTLEGLLVAIVTAWGAAKLTGGALDVLKLINGLQNLRGGGGNSGTGGSGGTPKTSTPKTSTPKAGAPKTGGPTTYGDPFDVGSMFSGGAYGAAGTGVTAAGAGAAYQMVPGLSGIGTGGGMIPTTVTAGTAAAGTIASLLLMSGIALGAASQNYTINVAADPHGYDRVEDRERLQTAVRGILSGSRNGHVDGSSAGWMMRYLMYHIDSPEQFFDLFSYNDADRGAQNWVVDMMGDSNTSNAAKGAMYALWMSRFGNDSTAMNGLTPEQRAAILTGQEYYAGGTRSYTDLYPLIWDVLNSKGMRDENGQWWIPSLYEENRKKQAEADAETAEAAKKMAEAALALEDLPEQIASSVKTALGGTKITISGFGDILSGLAARFGHANGIWSVPWDGYPAILHKNERVMSAAENQRYTYNTYFGNVNLNNGLEIDALTESIERRNRRQRAGFGAA